MSKSENSEQLYVAHLNTIYNAELAPSYSDVMQLEEAIHDLYNCHVAGSCLTSKNDYIKICLDYGKEIACDDDAYGLDDSAITRYLFIDYENWGHRQKRDYSRVEINILELAKDAKTELRGLKTRVIINRDGMMVKDCFYMTRPIVVDKLGLLKIQHLSINNEQFDIGEVYDRSLSKYDLDYLLKMLKDQKLDALADSHDIYSKFI